ncbi:type 4a pilus biogenesis protein PilO [Actinoplanes sp. Pm04-4]|uniref:Type 4a pilus biogenesis protein PilO n=1 Tax=Paractinoplanes pyxinae TaxID=2997416 RepID=A0ABT4B8P8_9ACTN|nr:type 4a pilus biogenesis protein PilO [Actinoplanes pyxinae]MCY1142856.1 type 4a pilus biogenesis protein PilO [Actinoplanes pyxinae]
MILVAAGWLLLISPKFTEASEVQAEADDTSIQLTQLRKEVAALKEQNAKKATYQAQLDTLVTHLPETYGIPAFLRALQDAGAATNVKVSDLSVGSSVASDEVQTAVELPLSLAATGTVPNLSKFITQLQQAQSRAVLIDTVTMSSGDEATANLTLKAFCTTTDVSDSAKRDRTDLCAVG